MLFNAQYRDLVRLVNYQRDKLSSQQAELTKYDAEIVFWEGKTREHQHQMEFMSQESARMEAQSRQAEDQVHHLYLVVFSAIILLLKFFVHMWVGVHMTHLDKSLLDAADFIYLAPPYTLYT